MMNPLKSLLTFLRFELPEIVKLAKRKCRPYQKHRLFTGSRKEKERAVMRLFRKGHGYEFDFQNPRTLNEKMTVRKLSDDPRLPILADKFAVREYVRETVGEKYLVPLLFTGMTFTAEDFRKLPRQCVIKTTHASGTNIFIYDKEKEDAEDIVRRMRWMQKIEYGYGSMELFYNKIPPRIIVEEMLTEANGKVPMNYRFHCFPHGSDGRKKCFISADTERVGIHMQNLYDENWEPYPFRRNDTFPLNPEGIERPEKLAEMLDVAWKLTGDWPYVRIDLYDIGGRVYFSEMTFTHGAGMIKFDPPEWDAFWGGEWRE